MKMRYKGEYSPTYMLDPEDYEWYPLEKFCPLLDKNHYVSSAYPERCLATAATEAGALPHPTLYRVSVDSMFSRPPTRSPGRGAK